MSAAVARDADRAPARSGREVYLLELLAEQRDAMQALVDGVALATAWRTLDRAEAVRARRGPHDIALERVVLAAAIRAGGLPPGLRARDFGEPLHRTIARAVALLRFQRLARTEHDQRRAADALEPVIDELALSWGYVEGLLRDEPRAAPEDLAPAVDLVAYLARQRRALALADDAVRTLRAGDCDLHGAAELLTRAAAAARGEA